MLKIGCMQPYFFPYLGYFDLIHQTDVWVVFDTAQYTRHSWMNRNRILHPEQGWMYITVPVAKHEQTATVREVCVCSATEWSRKMLAQLAHYRKTAPYYNNVMSLLEELLVDLPVRMAYLNAELLRRVCTWLGITMSIRYLSEMRLDLPNVMKSGDWALQVTKALGGTEYYNPIGGRDLFDTQAFIDAGINLRIQTYAPMEYATSGYAYESGLSILDALMWCTPEEIKDHLNQRKEARDEIV